MTTKMIMIKDINGAVTYGLPFCDAEYSFTGLLAANVAQSVTVPVGSDKYLAIFAYSTGGETWVANNATAVIPSGAVGSSVSQLNPVARQVKAADVLSLITPDTACRFWVAFYAI